LFTIPEAGNKDQKMTGGIKHGMADRAEGKVKDRSMADSMRSISSGANGGDVTVLDVTPRVDV
jgi:hypothetical protein